MTEPDDMNKYVSRGPFKCRFHGCLDREYHQHTQESLHDEIDHLRNELAEEGGFYMDTLSRIQKERDSMAKALESLEQKRMDRNVVFEDLEKKCADLTAKLSAVVPLLQSISNSCHSKCVCGGQHASISKFCEEVRAALQSARAQEKPFMSADSKSYEDSDGNGVQP